MATQTRIVAVLYVVLAAISWVVTDLRLLLIPTAVASLALFVLGLLVFRRFRGIISLKWPTVENDMEWAPLVIDGQECPFLGYDQELIGALSVRHFSELLACALLAAATLYVLLFHSVTWNFGPATYFYGAEFVCFAGWIVLAACMRWFAERWFIGKSRYTLGTILTMDPGFFRRGVTYQFFVGGNDRRGGRGPLWGKGEYNAVIVLYDPQDPDKNAPHGGFVFHSFAIGLAPARRPAASR